jgi:hypothetical protein
MVESSFLKVRKTEFPLPTSLGMISGDGYQLHGLHRSKLVYKCDVFSHSVLARTSLPSRDCLCLSSTQQSVVRLTKDTVQSLSQDKSQHLRTGSQAQPLSEKHKDLCICWPPRQIMPQMALEDLSQPSDYLQPSDFSNREQPSLHFNNAEWFDSPSGLYPGEQHQMYPMTRPRPLAHDDQFHLEEPTPQGQIHGQTSEDLWNINMQAIDYPQLDFHCSPERSDPQRCFDFPTVPALPNHSPQTYTFPLTPPSSTRSEDTSPADESVQNHWNFVDNVPKVGVGQSITPPNEPSLPNGDLTMPPIPQYTSPEMPWSNEEFARFLDSDFSSTKLGSFDHGSNQQSMLSSAWQYQTPIARQSTSQHYGQHQQGDWHSLNSTDPTYSYPQPSFPANAYQPNNHSTNLVGAMSNQNFGTQNQSLQPEASIALSSLFEGLSPDINRPTAGQRSGAKAPLRPSAKDQQLIEWKNQGLSYKEIKSRGGFEEAESTLRGRYRTLTKPKHLRVRKPEWPDRDVKSICQT